MNTKNSTTGMLLVGVGVFFFLAQIFGFNPFESIWPVFVILPGAAFLYSAYNGDKRKSGLAIPGAVIGGTGVILLYQSLTGHWESWAYAWTLYPVFVGFALRFMGERTGEENTRHTGQELIRWGGTAFIIGAAFFELVVFDHGPLGNIMLPLLLIGAGAWLLMRGNKQGASGKRKIDVPLYRSAKAKNDRLQQQIDEALAEDAPETPTAA